MIFLNITHYKCQYLLACTSYTEPTCIMAVIIIRNWWQHYWLHIEIKDSDSWILCSVLFINVLLMCAKLRNFYSLKRIIGRILENNRKTFWELQNRIFGKILSIIASSLLLDRTSVRLILKLLWNLGMRYSTKDFVWILLFLYSYLSLRDFTVTQYTYTVQ